VVENVSEWVAFDVGSRFLSIDKVDAASNVSFLGIELPGQALSQPFRASDLLFGRRLLEAFRGWRWARRLSPCRPFAPPPRGASVQ